LAKRTIDSAVLGNFGDCEPIGSGVSEMRGHYGPGYRVYFTRRAGVVYLLLGGDKSRKSLNKLPIIDDTLIFLYLLGEPCRN